MSSQEESESRSAPSNGDMQISGKRRRIRACDACRRRKVRCDGGRVPGKQCSNCTSFNYTCTYTHSAKKRFADPEYVQNLESQLAQTHELLQTLTARLGASQSKLASPQVSKAHSSHSSSPQTGSSATSRIVETPPVETDSVESSDDDSSLSIETTLKNLCLGPAHPQFLGKSSNLTLCIKALDVKQDYVNKSAPAAQSRSTARRNLSRSEDWFDSEWVAEAIEKNYPANCFPDFPLMASLIEFYFKYANTYTPLLHRQTFEMGIREGLHLRDEGFGSTVLLVCAIGSRFSDDPRVLTASGHPQSAGWKYFFRVQATRKAIKLLQPTLYDVQIPSLIGIMLFGAPCPQAAFAAIGSGIRIAQDLGAHRRKCYGPTPTPEGELLKRAFWVLIGMDRNLSSALGRPCCIQDEDFDLDLPIDCDDEFWYTADPSLAFKQPPGKLSRLTFFNHYIKLNRIHSRALRTIYAINKSKTHHEQHMVAELDSALNEWFNAIPDHLRWDPQKEDLIFLNQSALLYSWYHALQIVVHRQYIPSPGKPSTVSCPSVTICSSAARSTVHILDVQHQRSPIESFHNIISLFNAGIVLVINIWGGKRSGAAVNPSREMEDVSKCMKILKSLEPRWYTAGRALDVLLELANLPVSHLDPAPNLKRSRDADWSPSMLPLSGGVVDPSPGETRPMAGSNRVQQASLPAHGNPTASFSNGNFSSSMQNDLIAQQPLNSDFSGFQHYTGPAWNTVPSAPYMQDDNMPQVLAALAPSDHPLSSRNSTLAEPSIDDRYNSNFGHSTSPANSRPFSSPESTTSPYFESLWMTGVDEHDGAAWPDIASDTLALLSTAPNSMEWNDWGEYITSLSSGYGALHDDIQNSSHL